MEIDYGYMVDVIKVDYQGRTYNIEKKYHSTGTWDDVETIYEYNGHEIAKVEFVPGAQEAGEKPYQVISFNFNKERGETGSAECFTIEDAEFLIKDLFVKGYLRAFEQAHNMCSGLDSIRIEMLHLKHKNNMAIPDSFDKMLETLDSCKKEIVETIGTISNLR